MTRPSAYEFVQDHHRAGTSGTIDRAMTLVVDRLSFGPPADA